MWNGIQVYSTKLCHSGASNQVDSLFPNFGFRPPFFRNRTIDLLVPNLISIPPKYRGLFNFVCC